MTAAEVGNQFDCEFFQGASGFLGAMGSAFLHEMTEEQISALAAVDFASLADEGAGDAFGRLSRYLRRRGPNARQDLAVDYARVFLAAGIYDGDTAVPYESVFTSSEGILMQDARDQTLACYRAWGMEVDPSLQMPEDHLGFQLEFAAFLCRSVGDALACGDDERACEAAEALASFIDAHLLNWLPQLQARVEEFAQLAFYPALVAVSIEYLGLLKDACAQLIAGIEGQ